MKTLLCNTEHDVVDASAHVAPCVLRGGAHQPVNSARYCLMYSGTTEQRPRGQQTMQWRQQMTNVTLTPSPPRRPAHSPLRPYRQLPPHIRTLHPPSERRHVGRLRARYRAELVAVSRRLEMCKVISSTRHILRDFSNVCHGCVSPEMNHPHRITSRASARASQKVLPNPPPVSSSRHIPLLSSPARKSEDVRKIPKASSLAPSRKSQHRPLHGGSN